MKLLIALIVVSAVGVSAGEDWKMFMKWAKTKAMESCWGEENIKIHTLNMKKAVSKCLQVDAPETELPPFRYLNRFTNDLVNHANSNPGYGQNHGEDEFRRRMKMMMMAKMINSFGENDGNNQLMKLMIMRRMMNSQDSDDYKMMNSFRENDGSNKLMKLMIMRRMMNSQDNDDYKIMNSFGENDGSNKLMKLMMMKRFMVGGRCSYHAISNLYLCFVGRIPEETGW